LSPTARIVEFIYLLRARLAFLTGRCERSRTALKAALRRNPHSFPAHFLLGRLYWQEQSAVKAKREFDLAWQIDPERFERAYSRLRLHQDGVPELFSYAGDQAHHVPVQAQFQVRTRRFGDFRDEDERQHFEDMPPITRDEILRIDWDRFEEEIHRDQESL